MRGDHTLEAGSPAAKRSSRGPERRFSPLGVALAGVVLALQAWAGPAAAAVTPAWPTLALGDRGTDTYVLQALVARRLQARPSRPAGGRTMVDRAAEPAGPTSPTRSSPIARSTTSGSTATGPDPTIIGSTTSTTTRTTARITLVRRQPVVAIDGVFGESTAAAVASIQRREGLPATGFADAATWDRLVTRLADGSAGEPVRALQRELREKHRASIAIDGRYGSSTAGAVRSFQRHMGLPQTGTMDAVTWRTLVWHFEEPMFSSAALCDYDWLDANWGTASTVAWLELAGRTPVARGDGRVAVGDLGYEHGGDIPIHETHEDGLDADLRPMRNDLKQCSGGTNWTVSTYDRTATRALAKAIRDAAPGRVKVIYFNDPVLVDEGVTTWRSGHDDHLHVRYCVPNHPQPLYAC